MAELREHMREQGELRHQSQQLATSSHEREMQDAAAQMQALTDEIRGRDEQLREKESARAKERLLESAERAAEILQVREAAQLHTDTEVEKLKCMWSDDMHVSSSSYDMYVSSSS